MLQSKSPENVDSIRSKEPKVQLDEVGEKSHHSPGHSDAGNGSSNGSSLGGGGRARSTRSSVGRRLASGSDISVVVVLLINGVRGGVVVARRQTAICFLDGFKDTMTSRAGQVGSRDGPGSGELGVFTISHRARVGLVETQVGDVNVVVDVACLVGDQFENIGTTVLNIHCQSHVKSRKKSMVLPSGPERGDPSWRRQRQ